MKNSKKIYHVEDKLPFKLLLPLSIQHTFAMFGASVLVPILFKINPGIVLFMNGIGTLLFILITKKKAPAYLGSSFAFLAPGTAIIASQGFQYAQGAFIVVGTLGCFLAYIIYKFGIGWIDVVLPPAAMGSVVALIGFELAGNTVTGGSIGANLMTDTASYKDFIIFGITLFTAIIGSVSFKGFLSTIPILIAIVVGYICSVFFGMVDFTPVLEAKLFTLPNFSAPKFSIEAILSMLPVILVITSEHISHQVVTSNIIGRNLLEDPGLHRSIFADNFSSALSGLVGGVPTTTYGENIGVMAITGVYSVQVIGAAAIISILMAFVGPLAALIQTIPGDVIGGVTFLLYGMIGTSGIRLLVDQKVDYSKSINLILTSTIFIAGLSGLSIKFGSIQLQGMVLASVVAVLLSAFMTLLRKLNLINQ
ncbi:uracil permease [Anaerococcus sp. HMSC075B03]|uniref:Uracil permease n=2 Tax=Anaerococcus vaginalis TaxID=33037 RepID=A0A6N2R669_9FIRM|nr:MULTISPECIES: uracil permease [Anaerococcus]MBS4889113.1 uracil permease [Anaerococcus vaginalis]MDU1031214.1 uracil permease [Anaerococcus vaginalis]MDU2648085.1 uracil permease [Anaerococcus vaginalis]MDU4447888.1 uracil permease [Anaerococcus vaginalis]MDU5251470.1 uracil permease [Anaerococcus vaginalis]